MKTFKCNFGKGVACEIHVTDAAPAKGERHILKVEWTGEPGPRVLRPYIAWINSVNQTLADEWNRKIGQVFQVSDTKIEKWIYEPGKQPRRVIGGR